jgi:hypothetical protein
VALGLLTATAASSLVAEPAGAQDAVPGRILKLFAVGGVLTEDGTLWQYSPSRKWQTIDDAFRDQGRETKILPLPVPAASIREMVTFGFLMTDSGDVWLYELEDDRWIKLAAPPAR